VTSLSKPRAKSGSRPPPADAKVEHPAKSFADPMQVVADPALSAREKQVALDALEQDARQLATASMEGMSGGEETNLRDVLQAERYLGDSSTDNAFAVVARTLEDQLRETRGTDTHVLIARAIDAITAARTAMAARDELPAPPPGVPEPGSTAELQEELDKEKLDPGA